MISCFRFPFSFDASQLRSESEAFLTSDWIAHFNTYNYEGDWSGIALRAPANAHPLLQLFPDPNAATFVDTPNLARCPYAKRVIDSFACEKESARFLRLGADAVIKPHRDHKLSFEDGIARVHIPIKTSDRVEFYVDDQRINMTEGEAWYINFNLQHSVINFGPDDRIHLVIDCVVNGWLRGVIRPNSSGPASGSLSLR